MFFYIFLLIVFVCGIGLIIKRHKGCGIAVICFAVFLAVSPFVLLYLITRPPAGFHKGLYTEVTGRPYPASAKVIEKAGGSGLNTDYDYAALIEVDRTEYQAALRAMMSCGYRCDTTFHAGSDGYSILRKACVEESAFNQRFSAGGTHQKIIAFHCSGQVIFVEKFRY